MQLIDKSYFVGQINIPNTNTPEVLQRLNFFIAKYEKEYLQGVLAGLYSSFTSGISVEEGQAVLPMWVNLQKGVAYNYNQGLYEWEGLINPTLKQSPVANYVYYWWMRDQATLTSGVGEVKPKAEKTNVESPAMKMVRAWNEMVDWNKSLINYLNASRAVYTAWSPYYSNANSLGLFSKINAMNL